VFEPFFTTKPSGVGTGLGLSQTYGFAIQSGGTVQIHSAPGSGTTVEIWLPRSMREPADVRPAPTIAHAPA
jgi:signal transduction histidine kinase